MYFFAKEMPEIIFHNAGNLICREGYIHERRIMQCWVMIYVLAGTLNISSDGREYAVRAGEWIVLKSGAEHFGTSPSCGELSYLWAHFSAPLAYAQSHCEIEAQAGACPAIILSEHAKAVYGRVGVLFRQIVDIFRRGVYSPLMAQYALGSLLMEMTQEHYDSANATGIAQNAPIVEDINELLRLNCHRQLDIKQIAAHFHYNPEYLSALYKKLTGVTLTRAANKMRIEIAKQMLEDRSVSIKQAAFSCGFSDEKYFMRVFRSFEGMTPTEYRAAIGVK